MTRILHGYCTVKCYNHSGTLLWIGDQGKDSFGVAVDSSGNCYTTIDGSYEASYANYNIIEKRSPTGRLSAQLAMEQEAAPEIGVGHYKTTGAPDIAVVPAGVYFVRKTNGDNGTSFTRRVEKYDAALSSGSTLPQTNGSTSFTTALPITHIAASGTLVAITALSGATSQVVAAWTSDALNNVITTGGFGSGASTTGLVINSLGQLQVSRSDNDPCLGTWDSTPAIISQVGTGGIQGLSGIAVSGSDLFGLNVGGTAIPGVIYKLNGSSHTHIGANSDGDYAASKTNAGSTDTLRFYDATDTLVWSDDWGTSNGDSIHDIYVTADRVYAVGKRVYLT